MASIDTSRWVVVENVFHTYKIAVRKWHKFKYYSTIVILTVPGKIFVLTYKWHQSIRLDELL
jgi:hypothetical protein